MNEKQEEILHGMGTFQLVAYAEGLWFHDACKLPRNIPDTYQALLAALLIANDGPIGGPENKAMSLIAKTIWKNRYSF